MDEERKKESHMTRAARRSFGRNEQRGHSLVETILATAMSGMVLTTTLHAAGKVPDVAVEMAIGEARDFADRAKASGGDPRAAFIAEGAKQMRVDYRGFDQGASVTAVPGALGPVSFGTIVEYEGKVRKAGFSIDLLEIPKSACTRVAAWSAPDFDDVIVNGRSVGGRKLFNPGMASDACSAGTDIRLVIFPRPVENPETENQTPAEASTAPTQIAAPATSADILASIAGGAMGDVGGLEGRLAAKEMDAREAGKYYVERKDDVEAYDEAALAMLRSDPELMRRAIEMEKARLMDLYAARTRVLGGTPAHLEAELLSTAARYGISASMVEKALAGESIR